MMFVDYSKAFDSVHHTALWKSLIECGTPEHLGWLLEKLYSKASGDIRLSEDHTDQFQFEQGVRQGCVVSPFSSMPVVKPSFGR